MPNPHGVDARELFDSEHAQVMHITLPPGEGLRRHVTPVDVCFYVLAGRPTVEVGDERLVVEPDTLVESPAGVPHRVINEGEEAARFLVIKAPRQTQKTRLVDEDDAGAGPRKDGEI
jgi:mannose-6-phosphate isomerase-like protein (cupin superfamily)